MIMLISYEFRKNRHSERHTLLIDINNFFYLTSNLDEFPHRKCAKQCIECFEFRKNRHSKSHISERKCISVSYFQCW